MPTTIAGTMKAVRIHRMGGPEVLSYEDAPRPEPGAGEMLVRVHAAGVNPVDWKIRQGLFGRILLPFVVGSDFSGVVEALGTDVTEFNVGDAIFGSVADESGSYAEYALASAAYAAAKPAGLDHVQAAAIPIPALTAWQALFDAGHLERDQTVLIHAAAGGVGSFAVQFAKWKGAHVIGTASARNAEYVRELGADEFIDYHAMPFDEVVRDADVVLDTIGGKTQERSWETLRKGGVLVSLVEPVPEEESGVRGVYLRENAKRTDQLARIADLVVRGEIRVPVETILPLREARRGQEISQSGHARGKIVLVVEPDAGMLL